MVHESFVEFMEQVVNPLKDEYQADPDLQLNGHRTGSSREVVGRFKHNNDCIWGVHADTHFGPLLLAYEAAKAGADPFEVCPTARGECLILTGDLRQDRSEPKYLYIYRWPTKAMD